MEVSIYGFLHNLKDYIEVNYHNDYWIYSDYKELGSLLMKDMANESRFLFRPWDTEIPVGKNKIQNFINLTPEFKKKIVNNYIIICRGFRPNAQLYPKVNKYLTLLEVSIEAKKLCIYGSMNLNNSLLKMIIRFGESIKYEIYYDIDGTVKHQGTKQGHLQVERVGNRISSHKVFISYSWDSDNHKFWVLKLAADLLRNGIDVLIDEWNLEDYKNDLHYFMESGIREADYVLIICTSNYANRANKRVGGVGAENTIITGEFYNESKETKFIPIIRNYASDLTDALPTYLKSKYAMDFVDDTKYSNRLEDLIRKIAKIPKYTRPAVGQLPKLKTIEL